MSDPVTLVTSKDRYISDAKEVLNEAIAADFETVVVVGFKDGCVSVKSSKVINSTSVLGAIARAQHHLLK